MSDSTRWESPEAPDDPKASSAGTDQRTAHVPPQGQFLQGQFPQAHSAWTPPPKPGLIPLRPLDFGTILGAPYQALRRNPRPTFGMSLLLQGSVLFLTMVIVSLAAFFSLSRIDFATTSSGAEEIAAGSVGTILLTSLIPIVLSIVATAVMQGIVMLEVARQSLGEKLRFTQLWALAKGRLLALVGYALALTLVLILAVAVLVGIVVGLSLLGTAGLATGVVIAVLLALGLVVLGAWIGTKIAFVPSILLLERTTIRGAIARSWQLTDQSFWKIFGTLLLVAFILNFASSIAGVPLQLVSGIAPALIAPTGDPTAIIVVLVLITLVSVILLIVVAAVVLVVQSATTALLYLDQRIRKEGLDLDLARYVEARQAGAHDLPDPYRSVRAMPTSPGPSDSSPWA